MKFARIVFYCHKNWKWIPVRSVSTIKYNTIAIDIYKKNLCHQSLCNQKFTIMSSSDQKYSTQGSEDPKKIPIVYYDEIKDLPHHPEKLLIDVREPKELIETGKIPTSINIPLGNVVAALSEISDDKFKELYGIEKPSKSKYIIFQCMSGKRSGMASESAVGLGYNNVKNYQGSWLDWAEHEGLQK